MHWIQHVDLKFGWTQMLLEVGIQKKLEMQTMSTLIQASLFIMLAAQSTGKVNCKWKSHYQLQRLSIYCNVASSEGDSSFGDFDARDE
jgi:hypothetical protein